MLIVHYNSTAGYVNNIFRKRFELCVDGNRGDASVHDEEPAPLSSQYTRPDKDTAISSHKSNLIYVVIIIIIVCITNFTNVDI